MASIQGIYDWGYDKFAVKKAEFYIWKKSDPTLDEIKSGLSTKRGVEVVKVLINPSTISLSRHWQSNFLQTQGTGSGSGNSTKPQGPQARNLRMSLIFDLVDLYDKVKNNIVKNGRISSPALASISTSKVGHAAEWMMGIDRVESISDVNIFTPKHDICCYSALQEAVENNYVVMFVWGTLQLPGTIQYFDTSLDYFSKEGVPLRASVSLNIEEYFATTSADTKSTISTISSDDEYDGWMF